MQNIYVVVADKSRATAFALRRLESLDGTRPSELVPLTKLEHQERRHRDSELFTDSRPGLQSAFAGGPAHGVDDGRQSERAETDRQFAKEIVATIHNLIAPRERTTLIMAASPSMLGCLRKEANVLRKDPWLEIFELTKHLTRLAPIQLHDYLASHDLLPARGRVL